MIKIKVAKDNISIVGHANYDEYGKDIVCASVSSIVMTSVEAIALFDNSSINVTNNDNKLDISIVKHTEIIDCLITNMLNCLKEIEKQYPQNVKIINREE